MGQYLFNLVLSFILALQVVDKEHRLSEKGEPSKVSRTPLWQGLKKMRLEPVLSIGTDDLDKENYVFGVVYDIGIDHEGSIYVLDPLNYRVQKFSSQGRFLFTFGEGHGNGPGQFQRPAGIAIDSQKNLYVTDSMQLRITVFDSAGKVKATIPTMTQPWKIAIGNDGGIYITSLLAYEGPHVDKYALMSKRRVLSFCEPSRESKLTAQSGNSDKLAVDREGHIYVSLHYPYDIRKFSADGKLLDRFAREVKFFRPPKPDENGVMAASSGTKAITALPDGKLINVIYHRQKEKFHYYFDIFERDGTWLLSVPGSEFGIEWFRTLTSDSKGYLYISYEDPYPHLVKYSLTFSEP